MKKIPFLGEVIGSFKALVKRIGLHFLAICASIVMSNDAPAAVSFGAYIGIICLIPWGFDPRKIRFLVPFAASAGLFLLAWLWVGLVPQLALFWAGAQTWLLQALIRHFKLGWAWTAAPVILLAAGMSHEISPVPWLLLCLCTVAGYIPYLLLTMQENKNRLDSALRRVAAVLDPALQRGTFPTAFDCQFRQLLDQCRAVYALGTAQKSRYSAVLAPRLEDLAPTLAEAMNWPEARFGEHESNYLLASLAETNNLLADTLKGENNGQLISGGSLVGPGSLGSGKNLPGFADDDKFAAFQNSAGELLNKKNKLPEPLQKHLNALFLSTGSILMCMREDAEDVLSGTRFLSRYLPAVHKVVDEYIRLTNDSKTHENLQTALDRCEEMLGRMVVAFHEEHGNLLRNDAMRFNADLNVLDKLLKMDGR